MKNNFFKLLAAFIILGSLSSACSSSKYTYSDRNMHHHRVDNRKYKGY